MHRRFYLSLGIFLWFSAIILTLAPSWPHLYYRLFPQTSSALATTLGNTTTPQNNAPQNDAPSGASPSDVPYGTVTLDLSLPTTNGLIIDTIGVRGEIHEGTDWENILKTGIWRVPNFSTPEKNDAPIILAAHRWGYLSWTNAFRKLNSFYNLPKLKNGDIITINWNQRAYQYQVYKSETGASISDYSANLILYTCQLWDSPVRIFKYAKRIN